jgi:hypothetical protein
MLTEKQSRRLRRRWTLLDASQLALINGLSNLAAMGVGFDSHRPLQIPWKFPLDINPNTLIFDVMTLSFPSAGPVEFQWPQDKAY